MSETTCVIEGCGKRSNARGLCKTHYSQERRAGRVGEWSLRPNDYAACGTDSAIRRHRRRGEDLCEPCAARAEVATLLSAPLPHSLIEGEEWRPIPGYEGRYEVSSEGRVRSWARKDGPHLRRPSTGDQRYHSVTLCRDGRHEQRAIHTLVALVFIGPRPEGMEVRHLDGNSHNNRAANLTYGTHAENMLDQRRHGTHRWSKRKRTADA